MGERDEEKKEGGFVVKDRRRFDASGNPRSDETQPEKKRAESNARPQPNAPRPAARAPEPQAAPRRAPAPGPQAPAGDYPEPSVGFAEFILSIATNAVVHLGGETPDGRVPPRVNLALAAQHIDIIAMLAQKTQGNLDPQEQELVESLLYDLRMRYVEVAQHQARGR